MCLILVKACEAMYKFAEKGDENKTTLVELGAVEPLSKLISNEDKAVRINAVMALGVMASHNAVKKLLKKLDVIPSILARLAPAKDTLIHEYASLCLAYLSVEYTSKVQIFELNGLDTLISLLSSPDPDVKKNSLKCIYQFVQDFPSHAAIQELNGIPPLLELLKSEYPVIQQLALKTLATITRDAETRVALRENQGFEQLIEILGNNELNDLHVETLVVVSHCMEDMDTVQRIQQTGGLNKLLQLAETSTLPEVQMNAAKAITNTAQSNENRKILHEQEVEKTLATLLRVNYEGLRTAACQAIAIMCENLASKDEFRKLAGIQPIVQLLNSEHAEVKKAAALALSNLTSANHLNVNAVIEAEGVEALVQLLTDKMVGAVAHAADVLTNMCTQEALRSSILAQGAMQALTEALCSTNSLVLSKVVLAVAALACDSDTRTDVLTNMCTQEALRSKNAYNVHRLVVKEMRGPVEKDRLHEFFWELHVSELKFQLQSNVIPIGQIKKGTFYHRALLFKALADRIGINSSLVPGEYNRTWNEVLLADEVPKAPGKLFPPKAYAVDLMHSPGHFMKKNSPEAIQYQCI
ncbi:armadillo repeat-containing protein 3-like [Polyodon spathula]|uniref:armadillo repeat-containing protein 3-like n=1 Tax=Polyodon spathula TaxID=7913 RepID=UPI001B7F6833|nr:armadillo repeat-containing protein 3-like [Polyodon spathula]